MEASLSVPEDPVDLAALRHSLSRRGASNSVHRDIWGPRERSMANLWSPENPNGMVVMRLAENSLMHSEIVDFISSKVRFVPERHLTYSTGPKGSRHLRHIVAQHLIDEFGCRSEISADNISVTPGLSSAIDALVWAICDDGDGILIPRPYYNGFAWDLGNRSNVKIIGVSYHDIPGDPQLEDIFRSDINVLALDAALDRAKNAGIRVRALMISNPHNPLGRCYPPETLQTFASFCGRHGLHFLADEIYAKSIFPNPAISNAVPFTSVLSLDTREIISPDMIHVLYGASKDFCANGLRLGFVCTLNDGIMSAISSISQFFWSPHILQDLWAAMLKDKVWLDAFMHRKTALVEANYRIATTFLRRYNIPYFEANAGVFIWVDLRNILTTTRRARSNNDDVLSVEDERAFEEVCVRNGVMVAPSYVYSAEESGFFRITFAVEQKSLEEGLRRIWMALEQ